MKDLELSQEEIELIKKKREEAQTDEEKALEETKLKQEQAVARFIAINTLTRNDFDKRLKILKDAGFIEHEDYKVTGGWELKPQELYMGYSEDKFKLDIEEFTGKIHIHYKYYNISKNEIQNSSTTITSWENGKIEAYNITKNWRYYKPTSLLKKITECNNDAQSKFNLANKKMEVEDYTLEKYKTLYPKATVTLGHGWEQYSKSTFQLIKIVFESGSIIELRLSYEMDNEYIHRKVDAVIGALNIEELGNMFNNQPPAKD